MDTRGQDIAGPNPHASAVLSKFAFIVGSWRGEAKVKSPQGEWQTFKASWIGRFILDGYAIADEYRMESSSGEPIVLGLNLRVYDKGRQTWAIKWLHALSGEWLDLGSPELGGVSFEEPSISYIFKEPMAELAYTRATYTNISRNHFTWRGEKSDDMQNWSEFMVVELDRIEG
jgi:hypothetical protein